MVSDSVQNSTSCFPSNRCPAVTNHICQLQTALMGISKASAKGH